MTYEQAVYLKLLILCGYFEEYEQFLDVALEVEGPLSDVIVDLAYCGSNEKRVLSVLSEYISEKKAEIDYDREVFQLVLAFLRRKYLEKSCTLRELTRLMYQIAVNTEHYLEEPWQTMYLMDDYLNEAEFGLFQRSRKNFLLQLEHFLTDGS